MHLFNKHLANTCLPLEKNELYKMLNAPYYKDTLNQKMQESWKLPSAYPEHNLLYISYLHIEIFIKKSTQLNVPKSFKTIRKRFWAAAVFIFFASFSLIFFLSRETGQINQKDLTSLSTGIGEREYMILPDSNEIRLITGLTRKFPVDFLTRLMPLSYQRKVVYFTFNEEDAPSLTSWKKDTFVFENITFGKAAFTLQKPFGIEVLFENDTHRKCRFTANLDLKEDLGKVHKASTKFNAFSSSEENSNIYFI